MQTIAIYVFKDAHTADQVLDHLWRNLSGGFERSAGAEIWISSQCLNPSLASNICQSCGGWLK